MKGVDDGVTAPAGRDEGCVCVRACVNGYIFKCVCVEREREGEGGGKMGVG